MARPHWIWGNSHHPQLSMTPIKEDDPPRCSNCRSLVRRDQLKIHQAQCWPHQSGRDMKSEIAVIRAEWPGQEAVD